MKKIVIPALAFLFLSLTPLFSLDNEAIKTELSNLGLQIAKSEFAAPELTLETLDGKQKSLSDFKGKYIFLNFWATWCPPCRAEMPSMQTIWKKYQDKEFVIVAVNEREDNNKVASFLKKNGFTFPVLLDKPGTAAALYGIQGIPTTYILDKDGIVLGRLVGTREWDTPDVQKFLDKLLK